MIKKEPRNKMRLRRHARVRKTISGTADRPRLCVFRSASHIYAQMIDDTANCTLVQASSLDAGVSDVHPNGGNVETAKAVGKLVAERAIEKGIKTVIFDRGGYPYHGRVAALAEAAREAGLVF